MKINRVHKLEKAIITFLNFDGWDLQWSGGGYEHYDAVGATPKGNQCIIEMKFRNKYYPDKLLEKYKYDALMKLDKNLVKLYFINDPKGNFMYWLNNLKMPKSTKRYCPDTSLWTKTRFNKEVYLLKENQATRINLNSSY